MHQDTDLNMENQKLKEEITDLKFKLQQVEDEKASLNTAWRILMSDRKFQPTTSNQQTKDGPER